VPAVDLAGVGQLEQTLTDLHRGAVNLIEKEDHGLGAGSHKPVGSVPSGSLATIGKVGGVGQTKEVTLGHLGSTTLHDRQGPLTSDHVDDLGLADAVTTTNEDREPCVKDRGDGVEEGSEVKSHVDILWMAWCDTWRAVAARSSIM
jgi:hypothetical protein